MIDLECVASFIAVAETGSFGEAASQRGLSQSGISQHVSRLEALMGEQLLIRGRRATVPSGAGVRLLPVARELIQLASRAQEVVRKPKVMLGASGNIATTLVPSLMKQISDSGLAARVPVEISSHPNPELIHRLRHRLIDIALTEWAPVDTALHATPWRIEPMGVIVPPGHRLASQSRIAIDQLIDEQLIGGESGSGTATILRNTYGAIADRLSTKQSLGSTEGVKRLVMAELGVSIVMRIAVEDELARGELVWLELEGPRLEKTLHVVRRADDIESAAVHQLLSFFSVEGVNRSAPRAAVTRAAHA